MQPFTTRTVGDVVAEILMSRTAFSGSFLVLEGETDSKFFSRRVAKVQSQIVIAGGKSTVCNAVARAYLRVPPARLHKIGGNCRKELLAMR